MKILPWPEHKFFSTDHIKVPLPIGHRFPMSKYQQLSLELLQQGILNPEQLSPSPAIALADLLKVHTPAYVEGIQHNTLDSKQTRAIGLPITPELFERSLAAVGGFTAAALASLTSGFSAQLAGGTHHAFADHGEGFCVFNDFAVAAVKLLSEDLVKKILILDLDVHQGNGTSSLLAAHPDVFIVSFHGERNYPFRKIASDLDVALPAGTTDSPYLAKLESVLADLSQKNFDIIFYQAGVDVLEHDSLGTFKLTFDGVRARDRMVFEFARRLGLPLAMGIGGGYSVPIEHTVAAHVGTFLEAKKVFT